MHNSSVLQLTILTILTKTEKEKHFGNPVTRKKEEKNERGRKSSR